MKGSLSVRLTGFMVHVKQLFGHNSAHCHCPQHLHTSIELCPDNGFPVLCKYMQEFMMEHIRLWTNRPVAVIIVYKSKPSTE